MRVRVKLFMKSQSQNVIVKYILLFGIFMLFLPFITYGYYIIDNIPDTRDDHLRPEINGSTKIINSQIIDDVTTDVITTTTKVTTTTIIETIIKYKRSFQVVGVAGAAAGVVAVTAGTAVPFFATTPTIIQDLMLLNLFGVFVRRKKQRRWGIVFDIDTKRPIAAAKVTLFDDGMKELETTYSDKDGRFGFLAGKGTYKLDAYKKNYKAFVDNDEDKVYGKLYTGDEVNVIDDEVLMVNIALQSTTIDWKEYADKKVASYTSTWSLVKKYLFTALYLIGFIATILITFFYPSIFNIVLVIINFIFFIAIYFFKKKDHGTVTTDEKRPVPFAVVNLYDNTGKKDAFAVTDVIGRYYMLADNGRHKMKVKGQSVRGEKRERQIDVNVKEGFVDKDVIL